MTLADLHLSHPAARGLRQMVALSSDRVWVMIAVLLCLLVSFEVASLLAPSSPPVIDGGIGL
jgi:hypothetical protein